MKISFRRIQTKILLSFLLLIALAGIIGGIAFLYQGSINRYQAYKDDLNELRHLMAQIDVLQKDFIVVDARDEVFMSSGKSKNITAIEVNVRDSKKLLERLKENPATKEFNLAQRIENLTKAREKYNRLFELLRKKVRERGFKSYGMEGRMRDYVHFLEKVDIDNELVLQLRRHEKDFFLRKDLEYKNKLHSTADKLKRKIVDSRLDSKQKETFLEYVNDYEKMFDLIVEIEKEIGLDSKKGLRGELAKIYEEINKEVQSLFEVISFYVEGLILRARLIVIAALVIMLIIGGFFAVYFSFSISRPIIVLDRVAKSVVKGLRSQDEFLDRVTTDDEVGDLAKNFKIMLQKLRTSIQEAELKNEQLQEFIKQEKQRSWENEGFAVFGEILKNNNDNIVKQSYEIITELTKRTNSVQGGLFIVNDYNKEEEPYLELTAAYAYDRQKYLKKRINFGEGLIGETWREGDTKLITDIPEDYTFIKSGTGILKPTVILIVPIKTDEKIEGVLELAAMQVYEPYVIDFVERLSRRIAINIAAVKANEKNIKLLEEAKDFNKQIEEKEMELQRRIREYDAWMQEFEAKLNSVAEESSVFQMVLSRIYDGVIITDEKFTILKVNSYILRKFRYKRSQLEGNSVDVLVETDYKNIIDLKDRKLIPYNKVLNKRTTGKIIDPFGNKTLVQMSAGKLEVERKIFYIFLFNEVSQEDVALFNKGDSFLSQN
ncbi:MAG: GAF domain-containing protein [Raineya sp.]|nr:GAF domain-containing protein [Raineya sp.]MDW8295331.1 GAF domain-containing protein [Raineya sp.]